MTKSVKHKKLVPTISYASIAYVYYCGDTMIDAIEHCNLPIEMTGEGMCLVDFTMLEEYIKERANVVLKNKNKVLWFLNTILSKVQSKCLYNIEPEPAEIMFIV